MTHQRGPENVQGATTRRRQSFKK